MTARREMEHSKLAGKTGRSALEKFNAREVSGDGLAYDKFLVNSSYPADDGDLQLSQDNLTSFKPSTSGASLSKKSPRGSGYTGILENDLSDSASSSSCSSSEEDSYSSSFTEEEKVVVLPPPVRKSNIPQKVPCPTLYGKFYREKISEILPKLADLEEREKRVLERRIMHQENCRKVKIIRDNHQQFLKEHPYIISPFGRKGKFPSSKPASSRPLSADFHYSLVEHLKLHLFSPFTPEMNLLVLKAAEEDDYYRIQYQSGGQQIFSLSLRKSSIVI